MSCLSPAPHAAQPSVFHDADEFDSWFAAPFRNCVVVKNELRAAAVGAPEPAALPAALASAATSAKLSAEEAALVTSRLHAVLRPFLLRRLKADVLPGLPPCSEVVLRCPMSALQAAMYERSRAGLQGFLRGQKAAALQQHGGSGGGGSGFVSRSNLSASNVVLRLRQICNHPFLLAESWTVGPALVRSCGKFEVLYRLLPALVAAGHRVLVFAQWTGTLDLLEDLLGLLALQWLRLDGSTGQAARVEAMREFNAPHSAVPVFLLSTRAGGLGINLATADTVIVFDSDWNPQVRSGPGGSAGRETVRASRLTGALLSHLPSHPQMDLQALARAHRMGQTRDVRVIRLVSCGPPVCRGFGFAEAISRSLAPAVAAGIAAKAAAAAATTPSLRRLRSAALLPPPTASAAASPSLDSKSSLRTRTPRSLPEPPPPSLSGGSPPRWSYSLSVEELLQLRAHGKLRTEEAVIQRGQFHHGLGRREGGADTSSPSAVSSPVARASEPQGGASPSPSPRASPPPEPPAADMRLLLESVAAGPVAAAPPGPTDAPPVTTGNPFDALSDTQLFGACARSPADLDALLTWARYARGRLGALTLPPLAPPTATPNAAANGNASHAAEPDDDEAEEQAYQLDDEDYINAALALTAPCAAALPVLPPTPPPAVSGTSAKTSSSEGQQKKKAKGTPSLLAAASASADGESAGKRGATSMSGSLTCLAGASVSGPGGPAACAQAPSGAYSAARPRSLRPPLTALAELDAELRRFVETR